ncbi:MAG: ABC transporter permease [Candidatus Thermoplasmatota archaeon]|jgi:peptide/nickel transport system permease protein|nr:ABC transporter permease [Candidatus Thermoplasmatota archaeon]
MTEEVNSTRSIPNERVRRHSSLDNAKSTFKLFLKNRIALIGMVITIIYFLFAILDYIDPRWLGVSNLSTSLNFVPGHLANTALPTAPNFSGSWWYWFGTTYSRIPILPVMLGALRFDLTYTVTIVFIGMAVGVMIGSMAGYFGGIFDEIVMRITDIFFSLPFFVFALAIVYVLGFSFQNVVIALIIIWWPTYARLTRGLSLETKSLKYVEAARASGASNFRILFRHIIPNVLSPVYVQISLDLGSIIQIFAGIFFLIGALGSSSYPLEIGYLLSTGLQYLSIGIWWPVIIPALFLLVFTVAVNLMGDGLRDVLDPKLRR